MSDWGALTYGDPCRECRFDWTTGVDDAVALISMAPMKFGDLVDGATGAERAPDLGWNVTGYVSHVADNLRIWAERLVTATFEQPLTVSRYDADALGCARCYNDLPLSGAIWVLGEAVESWQRAWSLRQSGLVLIHPDRGRIAAEDVARTNGHDVFHHQHDVHRCLNMLPSR